MFSLKPYRKKMFVSSRIQGRLMFRIGLYWVLYHVVLWHALFVFRYAQHRLSGAVTANPLPFRELYGQFVIDYYPMILCAVITLPVVVIDMLHLTHRVAGPLVRFKNALRDLKEGKDVERVKLRKSDLLTEFEKEFNDYLAFRAAERRKLAGNASWKSGAMSEDEANVMAHVSELREAVHSAVATADTHAEDTARVNS